MQTSDQGAHAQAILGLTDADIAPFLRKEISSKQLSHTIKALNAQLNSPDTEARALARTAIERLGFIAET